jgi:hypothetical protein
MVVRPEGANHQWRKIPPRELSIDLEADERLGRATGLEPRDKGRRGRAVMGCDERADMESLSKC